MLCDVSSDAFVFNNINRRHDHASCQTSRLHRGRSLEEQWLQSRGVDSISPIATSSTIYIYIYDAVVSLRNVTRGRFVLALEGRHHNRGRTNNKALFLEDNQQTGWFWCREILSVPHWGTTFADGPPAERADRSPPSPRVKIVRWTMDVAAGTGSGKRNDAILNGAVCRPPTDTDRRRMGFKRQAGLTVAVGPSNQPSNLSGVQRYSRSAELRTFPGRGAVVGPAEGRRDAAERRQRRVYVNHGRITRLREVGFGSYTRDHILRDEFWTPLPTTHLWASRQGWSRDTSCTTWLEYDEGRQQQCRLPRRWRRFGPRELTTEGRVWGVEAGKQTIMVFHTPTEMAVFDQKDI